MANSTLSWTPITEEFGAQVDFDLNEELSSSMMEELNKLFDERHMLLFRGRPISYEAQKRAVGALEPLIPEAGDAKYISTAHDIEGKELKERRDPDVRVEEFHSDLTWMKELPIRGISLYAEDVSDTQRVEGTRFVSTRKAYLDLPQSAIAELSGRTAIHLHALGLTTEEQMGLRERPFDEVKGEIDFWAEHPVLIPSPRTCEPLLLYNRWFTHSIVGLSREESRKWFERFDALLYQQQNIYTHHWQKHDLIIWDNFVLQHAREHLGEATGPVPIRVLRRAAMGISSNIYSAEYTFDAEHEKRIDRRL